MSDTLRDRIVAVLYEDGQRPMNTAARLADAVIAALGAQPQWRNDFYIETGIPPAWYTGPIRYVTDWETA